MLELISNPLRLIKGEIATLDEILSEVERQSYWLQGEVDWNKYTNLETLSERVAHAAADYYINWIKKDAQKIFGSPTDVHTETQGTEVIKWFYVPVHATKYDDLIGDWVFKETYAYCFVGVKANFGKAIAFENKISQQEEKDPTQIANRIIEGIGLKGFWSSDPVETPLEDLPDNIQRQETREGKMPEFNPHQLSKYILAELVRDAVFDFHLCKNWVKKVHRREDTSPERETLPLAPQELQEYPFTLPNLIRTINAVLQTTLNLRTSEFWVGERIFYGGGRGVNLTFSLLPPQAVSANSEDEKISFPLIIEFTFAFPHGWAGGYIPTDFSVRLTSYQVAIGDLTSDAYETEALFGKFSVDYEYIKRLIKEENKRGQEWYETVYEWSSPEKPIASTGMNLNEVKEIVAKLAEHLKGTELFRKYLEWNDELKEIITSFRLTDKYEKWLTQALPRIWANSISAAVVNNYLSIEMLDIFRDEDYLPKQISIDWSSNGLQVRFTVKPLGEIEILFKQFIIGEQLCFAGLEVTFYPVNKEEAFDFGTIFVRANKVEHDESEPLKQAAIATADALSDIFVLLLPSMIAQVRETKD